MIAHCTACGQRCQYRFGAWNCPTHRDLATIRLSEPFSTNDPQIEPYEKPRFVLSRSGLVHEFQCLSLTHDGPCECPLVLAVSEPRRRPKDIKITDELPT